jgi:hypothetical protein
MKKLIIALLLVSNTAYADIAAYGRYFGTISLGGAIQTILNDYSKSKETQYSYTDRSRTSTVDAKEYYDPTCELRSVKPDGTVIINNYCY